jgi:hypothetical protein
MSKLDELVAFFSVDGATYLRMRHGDEDMRYDEYDAECTTEVQALVAEATKFRDLYHAEIATSTRYADRVRQLEALPRSSIPGSNGSDDPYPDADVPETIETVADALLYERLLRGACHGKIDQAAYVLALRVREMEAQLKRVVNEKTIALMRQGSAETRRDELDSAARNENARLTARVEELEAQLARSIARGVTP